MSSKVGVVSCSSTVVKSHNTFARAIESFLRDVQRNEDVKSPFYKAVLSGLSHLVFEDCSPQQSAKCVQDFSHFVAELQSRQRRESKTRRVSERLQPLVNGLTQFTGAFDVLIQAAPAAALVLYGGARIVLQLSQSVSHCYDTILDIMEEIGHLLLCYESFSAAYASSNVMMDLLVRSYKSIICFWQKAAKLLSRKGYKTLLVGLVKPLDAEWQKCRENIDRDCNRVRALAQATEAELERQRDLDRESSKKDERRRCIVDWLKAGEDDATLDVRAELQAHLNRHHVGTCTWLYQDPTFKSWDDATTNAAIWYHAGPGAGKTILASALIKHLRDRGSKVIFYFYSFNDPARSKPINAIRCLILQLLAQHDTIPAKVFALYEAESCNRVFGLRDSETAVMVLRAFLECSSRTHIVLDGLDECSDQPNMKILFTKLILAKTCGLAKWMFTSRHQHDIGLLAQDVGAREMIPSIEIINSDIKKYLEDRLTSDGYTNLCVGKWTNASEGNFLWISLMHEILTGVSVTCDEDIEEELKKFPSGLTGCYLRGIRQISLRTDAHQELARRIIVFLVMAQQPLRLSELSNALAIRKGAEDHSSKRVVKLSLIQELCGHFVILDFNRGESPNDPFLKLAHKSIHEFFVQEPSSLGVPEGLRRFFVNMKSGHMEVGRACLTYLGYARYQTLRDVSTYLNNDLQGEHAFLKYATTFWFRHLMETDHSNELLAIVEQFVRSPAFWTCLSVQSKITPHLFATYVEAKPKTYRMVRAVPKGSVAEDKISFASPVPLWLDEYAPNGLCIALGVHSFIKEWQPVLTAHPDAIHQCKSEVIGKTGIPCSNPMGAKEVAIFNLRNPKEDTSRGGCQRLQSVRFEKERLHTLILESEGTLLQRVIRLQNLRVPRKRCSSHDSVSIPVPQSASFASDTHAILEKDASKTSLWLLDLQGLNLTKCLGSRQEVFNVPSHIRKMTTATGSRSAMGSWVTSGKSSGYAAREEVFAYHCSECHTISERDDDSGYQSANSSSKSDSESDSESDSDSTGGEGVRRSHCLIVGTQDHSPLWFSWRGTAQTRLQISCAFHPKEPLAFWTHAAHEICMANLHTGRITTGILPEPVDIQLRSAIAITKELRISSCGKHLHYLLCSFSEEIAGPTCSVFVSTFEFTANAGDFEPLRRSFPVQQIVHRFFESISSLSPPFVLTCWGSKQLLVALPKLHCDPKIVRFNLPDDVKAASVIHPCETLRSPIYFPSSTPHRRPQILIHDSPTKATEKAPEGFEHLILALDSDETGASGETSALSTLPPIIMNWSLSKLNGWRDWDTELDECSEELKNTGGTWDMLRGSYVDSEQRFGVPIRSGLDWTRKAFLSCA